jgi:transposase InsO family protein
MAPRAQNDRKVEVALKRLRYVSEIHAYVERGAKTSAAVRLVLERAQALGEPDLPAERTLYRWVKNYNDAGLAELDNKRRLRTATSVALPAEVIDFLRTEKKEDPAVSSPELIRRAVEKKLIDDVFEVNRSAVWRASKRMGLPTRRRPTKSEGDCRRFAYEARMMMMLADGKHFRAGLERLKRVAIFYIDDCTRFVLHVVVGTSESTLLFLRGLYEVLLQYGIMNIVYLDLGPGFKSGDTRRVIASIEGMHLILGTKSYPEGRGKVERFNRTAQERVLRGLDGAAHVDPALESLQLRLRVFVDQYNDTVHESLDGRTPRQAWHQCERALRLPQSEEKLREHFLIPELRKVSGDHIVKFDGQEYEVPRGLQRQQITVYRHLLDGKLSMLHQEERVFLQVVDKADNARARRRARSQEPAPPDNESIPNTAAERSFQKRFAPITGADGGFTERQVLPKSPDTSDKEKK